MGGHGRRANNARDHILLEKITSERGRSAYLSQNNRDDMGLRKTGIEADCIQFLAQEFGVIGQSLPVMFDFGNDFPRGHYGANQQW